MRQGLENFSSVRLRENWYTGTIVTNTDRGGLWGVSKPENPEESWEKPENPDDLVSTTVLRILHIDIPIEV